MTQTKMMLIAENKSKQYSLTLWVMYLKFVETLGFV